MLDKVIGVSYSQITLPNHKPMHITILMNGVFGPRKII